MAARNAYPTTSQSPGVHWMVGSFQLNDTSAPTLLKGSKYIAVRTGVGQFLITYSEQLAGVYSADANIEEDTGGGTAGAKVRVAANQTLTLETQSAEGVAADLDGPRLHFRVAMQNTVQEK